MPDAQAWRAFDRLTQEGSARVLFFEGEPHTEVRKRLSAMGIRVIVFEPAGNRAVGQDWLARAFFLRNCCWRIIAKPTIENNHPSQTVTCITPPELFPLTSG